MSYTITNRSRCDDYIITFSDGRVLVLDGAALIRLASVAMEQADNVIDIYGLLRNADAANTSMQSLPAPQEPLSP